MAIRTSMAALIARLAGLAHPPPVREDRQTGDGFLLERKKGAVALHYRLAEPTRTRRVLAEVEGWRPRWEEQGLEVLHGKKVVEVRRRGWHKGRTVEALKALWPEAVFFYLGDDRTDEDAFAALAGGEGVTVLVGKEKEERSSLARYRLPSPGAVHRFLERLLHLVEPRQGVSGQ
ncbi:MAG: trehalose-phosphatase [Bacillota bacterium]|nr:trehalose-phosphatase [Bacillota bacterium]